MKLLLRWLINAVALLLLTELLAGFHVDTFYHALIAALVLGLINAVIRPILLVLTLPVNLLTLGLFTFVVNALMILLMGTIVKGVQIEGFWTALAGAIILWTVSVITNHLLKSINKNDRA
ncbi:phage holin family protein [Patescibacteria group bacterium]|nr:phage holin family protein [Patescibacteria group bacterium]MBU4452909.1 phage holin family protein [Patescibacteria group bacterium]MCG2687223.1 phage holin family protein [Candidatus Parcubacteria bacterium]